MDYIHTWLNKWRMQGNFTKSKVMVFHPKEGESCSVWRTAGAWTLGGIAIDQVSKYYKYPVYQERIMAGTRAKGACKDASSLWVLEATAVMQQSADKGQTAHGSDLHLFRGHVWRGSVDTTKAVKDKMSAVVKKALRILAIPRLLF
jgi:hypothetical protein